MNTFQVQSALHSCRQTKAHYSYRSLIPALMVMVTVWLSAVAWAVNPIPFVNSPLSPAVKTPGSASFTLTVNGTGFVNGATVYWNGNARTTTFVKTSQVTASINAADVANASTAIITVGNPAPGGGISNAAHFQIVKGGYTVGYGKLDFATDLSPQDVVTADFNGDGIADLAVATGNNSVSILLGKGDGTFPTHVEYPVPGHPISIVTGDFNGDGKIDLATVDEYLSEITILLGNGDGTFQTHQEYATGTHPLALATGDLNGDGKLDIVVADENDNAVAVLLGNGDGTFQSYVNYACGTGPSDVSIGDFNQDGRLDLAVANNSDGTAAILLGNGDGTFQSSVAFTTAANPNSLVSGDFNNDGKLDLAVGTSNKALSVLLGNGDGTFQNHKDYGIGSNAVVVAAADVNADGKLDLISANLNDNTISVLTGNGDGTFKGESVFPTSGGPTGLVVGDFNNNGELDIAVVASINNTVSVLTDNPVTFSPNILAFGKQTSGYSTSPQKITLKNNGTTRYTVGRRSFIGAFYTDFTQTSTCGPVLAPAATCTYSFIFTPTASEQANAQMLLTSLNGMEIGIQMEGQGNIPIYLAPRNISFPYQLLSTSTSRTDTFTNDSGVPITFTNIDLEGQTPDQFSMTTTCPVNTGSLGPGASCTTTITYTPTLVENASVTNVYYGSFTLQKQGVLVQGESTAVSVTPTTLNFGKISVGTTSPPMNLSFQNASSSALTISSASFTGSYPYWQVDLTTTTCPYPSGSVPANSTCIYSITFSPQLAGTFTATFKIGDPDPTGPQNITLNGTGQ